MLELKRAVKGVGLGRSRGSAVATHATVVCLHKIEKENAAEARDAVLRKAARAFTDILALRAAVGETVGFAKVVADSVTGRILGAAIVGPGASDVIAATAVAVQNGLGADALKGVFPHPSFGETLSDAVRPLTPVF